MHGLHRENVASKEHEKVHTLKNADVAKVRDAPQIWGASRSKESGLRVVSRNGRGCGLEPSEFLIGNEEETTAWKTSPKNFSPPPHVSD